MEIKLFLLRVFVAVAEAGNIQDAAQALGRSPSAVSMSLSQLEDLLGAPLFEGDRKTGLTELGRFLLDRARSQLLSHDRAMAEVQAFAKGEIGRLELACVPSVASNLLPEVIRAFTARWPGVGLDVRDSDTAAVVRAIERGTVEIGIAGRPRTGTVRFRPLFHDRLVLLCPAESPLAKAEGTVGWPDFAAYPLIANGITGTLETREVQALHAAARLMVRNTTSLLALVSAGVGVTILPELSVPHGVDGIVVRPFAEPELTREVGVLQRGDRPLSRVAEAFLSCFTAQTAGRIGADGSLLRPS